EVLFDSSGQLTLYAKARLGTDNQYLLQHTNAVGSPPPPNQFYPVDFGGGGPTYRCTLGGCLNSCGITASTAQAFCGDPLTVASKDPKDTYKGIRRLIGKSKPPSYTWQSVGDYLRNDGLHFDTAPNVAVAPVLNTCNPTPGPNSF